MQLVKVAAAALNRERYAPSFHLDDENLDPKIWCRFPILSSGFEKEMQDVGEYVQGLPA